MIVYEGSKKSFQDDINNGMIADRLDSLFRYLGITKESRAEYISWKNSLSVINSIISNRAIDDDVRVALEYQIPLTSKRVDFMIAGSDGVNDNVVIIELKQWENCKATQRECVVIAFTGGAEREVAHPSQQAYSYSKLIENFNESVRDNAVNLIPCAFLHNYKEENRNSICNERYEDVIKEAPVFLQHDGTKLSDFIASKVKTKSEKNLFDIIENGKLKPSKSLQDVVGSVLNGNTSFEMIDEQQVAYATVLKLVELSITDERKSTIIVQGGPGTGKSVIAINLLAKIINSGFSCVYTTKNSAPRFTFSQSLIRNGRYTIGYLKGLFKGSGSFYDAKANTFDCILVDEAHRLKLKSGMYGNLGENQIKEIINAAKISVFFIDEDQIVTTDDIGRVGEIKKQAEALGSKVYCSESLRLTSQFRCNGSDGYLAFLDDVLEIRKTANQSFSEYDYDIRIFDNPTLMREELRKHNQNNKARMIAGYCYPWLSKNDKSKFDIVLPDGFNVQWNFTTNSFATDPSSFDQVGCIHSTQGLEFDYVGIIMGLDIYYSNGHVRTNYKKRAKTDKSIKGIRTEEDRILADKIIRNTYKTLLSRGQKGCFIYCEDKELSNYFKKKLSIARELNREIEKYSTKKEE